ncbi:response regulator transcription factor [Cohnella hashimotonis]|uniref:Response regulator n=1 Tax=Cohnella hashimotonis TaxID=2826895 RepID=A0ABT6TSF9_9BACL|nr:response regulator [Cohnella hashimotonis]MDI4649789.1 response regulator [Cohnella hashimotonis]
MFSLLIVDDHKHQVDTLAATVDWNEIGITAVHKAYGGQSALAIIEAHPIDILITDIHMPGTTGLDLIEFIDRRHKKIDSILLTGYAEFEYAKKAIELHAVDYLIKPVRDEALLESVKKVIAKRQTDLRHHQSFEHATSLLHQNLPLLKENLLHDLLQGVILTGNQLAEKLGMYQIPVKIGDYVKLAVIKFDPGFYESYDAYDIKLFEYAIKNIAEELLSPHFHLWSGKAMQGNLTLLLLPHSATAGGADAWTPSCQDTLASSAKRLVEQVEQYLKGKVAVYVSSPAPFPKEVHSVYRSVLSTVMKSGERQGFFVVAPDAAPHRKLTPLSTLYQVPMLVQLMDMGDMEKINGKFSTIFNELEQFHPDSQAHIREAYLHLLSCFTYLAHKKGIVLEDIIGTVSSHSESQVFHSAKQLKAWSGIILEALMNDAPVKNDENHRQLVHKIHSYIEQNLGKDLNLQTISEAVYLHAVYLSKIYKEITGMNLSEYILRVRMEEAKNLLENTSCKIYEITERVGYQSPQHFIRRFKQYYGVTPEIYRKR